MKRIPDAAAPCHGPSQPSGLAGPPRRLAATVFAGLTLLATGGSTSGAAQQLEGRSPLARLTTERLPAVGRQSTELQIETFGRFAILAESDQGVAVQLVDRMAGPGPLFGQPGESDGRVDQLLDRGETKVVTRGPERATGEVRLTVRSFAELHDDGPPQLVEGKLTSSELDDFQQRSYAFFLPQRRRVVIEAAGRHLADLRLWQGGGWLVEALPVTSVIEPLAGRPLRLCRLTTVLEPGLYKLTAYGGPSQLWSEDDGAQPLHLRMGIPAVGVAQRQRLTVGPFGYERFLVPGDASFFRLELPEPENAELEVQDYDVDEPFASPDWTAQIDKRSLPPVAELKLNSDAGLTRLVTVRAAAGQPVVLQHFEARRSYGFRRDGRHWISTIHSGHPADSVDATGLLVRQRGGGHRLPEAAQAIELGSGHSWARRCNLLQPLTAHLEVLQTGDYEILSRGVAARFRVEPFLENPPRDYEPPPFRSGDSIWSLDAGFYVLTVEPEEQGILDLGLRQRGTLAPLLERLGLASPPAEEAVRASVRFGEVALSLDDSYTLYLNQQPGVTAGVVLREAPVDLASPLPLTQVPGEIVDVPILVREPGVVRAEGEGGARLELSLDGAAWSTETRVEHGTHQLRVRLAGDETAVYSLGLLPDRLAETTPLPAMEPELLGKIPDFPVLTDQAARFLDLERSSSATFLVQAARPALYRLESTGLLATEGNLRTRVIPSLARSPGGGRGRNFLIQRYLRQGDYQLTASTVGRSRGHLGVRLVETPLLDGGDLALGVAARQELEAGQAVAYRLGVVAAGRYRCRSLGVGRRFDVRLEDADGWPVERAVWPGSFEVDLEAGEYRLIVLPSPLPARQVTLVELLPEPPERQGHGPHDLELATPIEHRWLEPIGDAPREADRWQWMQPAAAAVTITLSDGMSGTVVRGSDGVEVAAVAPRRGWRGDLARGTYEIQLRATRPDNRRSYQLAVWPTELVPGQRRALVAPLELPVSVGESGVYELSSFGDADVRARLLDEQGREIARSDDRPGDWGFLLVEALEPGRYRLRVDPVASAQAAAEVAMAALGERAAEPLSVPGQRSLAPSNGLITLPLDPVAAEGLLVVTAVSAEPVGLVLEALRDGAWSSLDNRVGAAVWVALPVSVADQPLRLLVWTPDRRGSSVAVAVGVSAKRHREEELRRGIELSPLGGLQPGVAAVRIDLDRAGCFRLDEAPGLRSGSRPAEALENAASVVATGGAQLWLASETDRATALFSAERLHLDAVRSVPFHLRFAGAGDARCDLGTSSGPTVVRARSVSGQPGVALEPLGYPSSRRDRMAIEPGEALTVALRPEPVALAVWSADNTASEARVEAWAFPDRPPETPSGTLVEGALSGVAWRQLVLPTGLKRLRLALEPGVAAALSSGGELVSVHWASSTPREETLDSTADRLALFHLGDEDGRFRVEISTAGGAEPPSTGHPFERWFERSGALRLELPPSPGDRRLRVVGAPALVVGADGRMDRGDALRLPAAGGWLRLDHGRGAVLAWVRNGEKDTGDGEALFGSPGDTPLRDLNLPASIALAGDRTALSVRFDEPALLSLRTAQPLVWSLASGEDRSFGVSLEAASFDRLVPAGPARLELRGVAAPLSGIAQLTSTPLLELGEGVGPEVLLGPGEARGFRFEVDRPGPVGIGVRATSEGSVTAVLLDGGGVVVGRGILQMPQLAPGGYVLVVRAADEAPPIRIRAALAGVESPGHGPPAAVIGRYLALARGEEPPAAVDDGAGLDPSAGWEEAEASAADEEPWDEEPRDEEEVR